MSGAMQQPLGVWRYQQMRRWSSVVCHPATEGRGRKTKLDTGLSAPNSGTRHGTGLQAGRGMDLTSRGRGLERGVAPTRAWPGVWRGSSQGAGPGAGRGFSAGRRWRPWRSGAERRGGDGRAAGSAEGVSHLTAACCLQSGRAAPRLR